MIAPDKIWLDPAWANTFTTQTHPIQNEYTRTSAHPVSVEMLAAVLWREQVVDSGAPQSVIDGRTPEAFADQEDLVREPFLKYARAANAVAAPVQVCPICDIAGCRHIRASASPMDVREAARVLAQHVITNCGTEEDDWIYVLSAICARTGGTLSDAMNALIAALRAIAETGGGE